MSELTHFDEHGNAVMVDVTEKQETVRTAMAAGTILVNKEIYDRIQNGTIEKGDVLGVARVAGIMAAKKTFELIPMCHILMLTKCSIDFELHECCENSVGKSKETAIAAADEKASVCRITAYCTVKTTGKTGVEMEALTGVQIALLTIYDMCKAIDKAMVMTDIHLVKKTGGKSGAFAWRSQDE